MTPQPPDARSGALSEPSPAPPAGGNFRSDNNAGLCPEAIEALVSGAQGIMCRPDTKDEVTLCDDLVRSVREGLPMRPADCPAVQRLEAEEASGS